MSGDLVIIDEAYAYTIEQQEAQTPVILARPNPQIIYTSSPPLSGETGDALYALRDRAEEPRTPPLDTGTGASAARWRSWRRSTLTTRHCGPRRTRACTSVG
jgi:hypothetical protein